MGTPDAEAIGRRNPRFQAGEVVFSHEEHHASLSHRLIVAKCHWPGNCHPLNHLDSGMALDSISVGLSIKPLGGTSERKSLQLNLLLTSLAR
jgi:hypothetical protein